LLAARAPFSSQDGLPRKEKVVKMGCFVNSSSEVLQEKGEKTPSGRPSFMPNRREKRRDIGSRRRPPAFDRKDGAHLIVDKKKLATESRSRRGFSRETEGKEDLCRGEEK